MILVVAEKLNLSFVLQHQGRAVRSVRTAREALQILMDRSVTVTGVIVDEGLPNARLVTGYITNNLPSLSVVPWRVAQRQSPFKNVAPEANRPQLQQPAQSPGAAEPDRYVWYVRQRNGEQR